jgi:hypothetical protein
MVIERDPDKDETTVHISKVCFEQTGYRGAISMRLHQLDDMQLWPVRRMSAYALTAAEP